MGQRGPLALLSNKIKHYVNGPPNFVFGPATGNTQSVAHFLWPIYDSPSEISSLGKSLQTRLIAKRQRRLTQNIKAQVLTSNSAR